MGRKEFQQARQAVKEILRDYHLIDHSPTPYYIDDELDNEYKFTEVILKSEAGKQYIRVRCLINWKDFSFVNSGYAFWEEDSMGCFDAINDFYKDFKTLERTLRHIYKLDKEDESSD